MATLAELQGREEEVAAEWRWLQTALNEVARARADQEDAKAFRLLQRRAMEAGQRRIELATQMAALVHAG